MSRPPRWAAGAGRGQKASLPPGGHEAEGGRDYSGSLRDFRHHHFGEQDNAREVRLRPLVVEFTEKRDIRRICAYEVERELAGESVDDYTVDFLVTDRLTDRTHLLVGLTRTARLAPILELLTAQGAAPWFVDCAPLAAARALGVDRADGPTAVVVREGEQCHIVYCVAGQIRGLRAFRLANAADEGARLVRQLRRTGLRPDVTLVLVGDRAAALHEDLEAAGLLVQSMATGDSVPDLVARGTLMRLQDDTGGFDFRRGALVFDRTAAFAGSLGNLPGEKPVGQPVGWQATRPVTLRGVPRSLAARRPA